MELWERGGRWRAIRRARSWRMSWSAKTTGRYGYGESSGTRPCVT